MAYEPNLAPQMFLQIIFYWNTAMSINLYVVCGCSHAIVVELSNCNRNCLEHLLSGTLHKNFEDPWFIDTTRGFCLLVLYCLFASVLFVLSHFSEPVHKLSASWALSLSTFCCWAVLWDTPHRPLSSGTLSSYTSGPAAKTHMQELTDRKVTFNQSQGFPVLLNLKVNRCRGAWVA